MSSLRWSYTSPMHPYSHTLFKIHTKNLETSRLLSFFNTKTLFVDQELCSFSSSFQDQRFWFSRVNFRFRKIFRMMMPRSRLKFIDYDYLVFTQFMNDRRFDEIRTDLALHLISWFSRGFDQLTIFLRTLSASVFHEVTVS